MAGNVVGMDKTLFLYVVKNHNNIMKIRKQAKAMAHIGDEFDTLPRPSRCFEATLFQVSSRMRSMRRIGSAAPQSNWSPTVNAPR